MRILKWCGIAMLVPVLLLALAWSFGALYYDGPGTWFAVANVLVVLGMLVGIKGWWKKLGSFSVWFAVVLIWWLSLKPSPDGNWQANVEHLPWAEIDGDVVTVHNVRNCDYRTEEDYTARWETRTVRLSQITHLDIAIDYWGSPWMAHPIISFQFADAPPLCFSIEARYEEGQTYSAIGGLYRQFQLVYIAADERDVIRVRTNYREGEDIYLYRTVAGPERSRERFMEYIRTINSMKEQPRWYNAITTNCTTAIRHQHPAEKRAKWDWRMLVNGMGDELMYERGAIVTDGLPFHELKEKAHINPAANAANESPDFSKLIREGRPGFGNAAPVEDGSEF